MRSYQIGRDYARRLGVTITADQMSLRTTIGLPRILWAGVLAALASPFFCYLLVTVPLLPGHTSGLDDITAALMIPFFVIGITIAYFLLASPFRRWIVLDRSRDQIRIRNRAIARLEEVDHIEKVAGLLYWASLAIVLRSGRKIYFLNYPNLHSSADTVAQTLADFLHVPYKDYGEGNYAEILRLHVEGDRLTMHPPNQSLARLIGIVAGILCAIGVFYFAWVLFPRTTGHEFEGGRGLGYIIFGVAYGVYYLATRIFHHRIVLDRRQNQLSIDYRKRCALSEVTGIGVHIEQKGGYLLAFLLSEDQTLPILTYSSRFASTPEVANRVAGFLSVPVIDYHNRNLNASRTSKRR